MKRLAAASLVALLGLLLTSCGSGGSGEGGLSAPAKARPGASTPYEGGERSVEGFGSEANRTSREAILAAEHAYLTAIAVRDFAKACPRLSASVRRSLERLARPGQARGCPAVLPLLLSPSAPALARAQAAGRVTRVRVKGEQAFVLLHAPGARLYVFTMLREAGGWKATALAASVLVPAPAVPAAK